MRTCLIAIWLLVLAVATLADDAPAPKPERRDIEIKGVVLDGGKPVAGAGVGMFWSYADGKYDGDGGGAFTNDKGEFTLKSMVWPNRTYKLMALAADQKRGALVVYKSDDAEKPITFNLGVMTEVCGNAACSELKKTGDGLYFNIFTKVGGQYLAGTRADAKGAFRILLPAGEYTLRVPPSLEMTGFSRDFTVPADIKRLDLTDMDLTASVIGKTMGKAAPEFAVTQARNLPEKLKDKGAKVKLADFRGKWVLIEFWGFW